MLIVGAGAKAAALAAKVHAINTLGLGPITLRIVEATEIAASWSGRNGMTSGEEPLAIPPIKDIGFPYRSTDAFGEVGEAIDGAVMPFSWQRYLIGKGSYARWINAGSPAVQHREYGEYLTWVLSRATEGVELVDGRVIEISLAAGPDPEGEPDRWALDVAEPSGRRRYVCRALVLTGPGVHRGLSHDSTAAAKMFHCDSHRGELTRIPLERETRIAIVGGGESALSSAAFLRAFRPRAQLTIYTPTLPMSRGESYLENRVFSDPDEVGWSALDLQTRRDFFKHCDRGVFDPGSLAEIAAYERCRFVTGRVVHVADAREGLRVEYVCGECLGDERYDFLVNCTGFDLLAQLRDLFAPELRAEIERRAGPLWDRPPDAEVAIGRALELKGMYPRLHIPGLGALSQGPGFANLGCLGLLANRVLAPLLASEEGLYEEASSRAAA
jgi:mycobactin lysine-N-oxygenase